MSFEIALELKDITKKFQTYKNPIDRLKQIAINHLPSIITPKKKYYKEFTALSGISAKIKKGEKIGIIGRNGSGKSTLLQIIAGTLTPTEGSVHIHGRVAALLELGSGFNPEFTGRDNIAINATVLGLTQQELKEKINSIIEFADIGDFIDQPVKTYSSGMFVRLAFAVIAHVNADILIIDEALAVGDTFFNQKCMRFMNSFAEHGTIILVTHDSSTVTGFCNRAIWIDKGRVVAEGNTKEVSEKYLASIYGSEENKKASTPKTILQDKPKTIDFIDIRTKLFNQSTLRNDLEIFPFNPDSESFGEAEVIFDSVYLKDEDDSPLNWCIGGEITKLQINCTTNCYIEKVIVGFTVRNRLGQNLFGENTFIHPGTFSVDAGNTIHAEFVFRMPIMPAGDYVISIAIADGTQSDHKMLKWLHDAIAFKSHSSSISTGILGIPMREISLSLER